LLKATLLKMKPRENKTRYPAFYKAAGRQVAVFFLLFAFANTTVFPSLFFVAKHACLQFQISAASEDNSSMAAYLLEGYLDVYDATPDAKGEDVKDLEELYDEAGLLHYGGLPMDFCQDMFIIKKYIRDNYPLQNFFYNSPTPPPEYYLYTAEAILS
jgi:hypothetical protein